MIPLCEWKMVCCTFRIFTGADLCNGSSFIHSDYKHLPYIRINKISESQCSLVIPPFWCEYTKKRKVDKLKSYLFKSTLNCLKTNLHKIPVSFTPNAMCSQKHRGGELALFLPFVNELLQYAALRHNLWETCPYYDIAQDRE